MASFAVEALSRMIKNYIKKPALKAMVYCP
jgi:hypothetical protein